MKARRGRAKKEMPEGIQKHWERPAREQATLVKLSDEERAKIERIAGEIKLATFARIVLVAFVEGVQKDLDTQDEAIAHLQARLDGAKDRETATRIAEALQIATDRREAIAAAAGRGRPYQAIPLPRTLRFGDMETTIMDFGPRPSGVELGRPGKKEGGDK